MKWRTCAAACAVVLGSLGVLLAPSRAADEARDKAKELMTKAHKGNDSPLGKVSAQLKTEEPAWEDVQKEAEKLEDTGKALGDLPGFAEKKPLQAYLKGVGALEEAAKKKDKDAALDARKQLLKSCAGCHYGGAPKGTGGGRE